MAEPEGSDEYDDDDEDHFPPLHQSTKDPQGVFEHLLNFIVEFTLYSK